MEKPHRYGIFIAGFYGNILQDSILTKYINSNSIQYPEIAEIFPMTDTVSSGCFCIFYQTEDAYYLDLMSAISDEYINVVFAYDRVEDLLLIHKGVGDAQELFEDYEEALTMSYETFFDQSFDTEDCVDMRKTYQSQLN